MRTFRTAFRPNDMKAMFLAFDRARRFSNEHPKTIADRIVLAAQAGVGDVDRLVEAAVGATTVMDDARR